MKDYSISVDPEDFKLLLDDIWSDQSVPAVLKFNDNRYWGQFSLRGHQMRKHHKKSFDFRFETDSFGIKTLHLNAEYKDPSLMRNKLSMDFFQKLGVLAPDTEHVLLYINDELQGVYLELESFDDCFLDKRNLPIGPVYYAINNDANFSLITPENELKKTLEDGYTRKIGSERSWDKIRSLILFINTASDEEFKTKIQERIDIETYFLWLSGVICTQNFDGFIHNYALYLNPQTCTFQISPWDYDGTWGRNLKGKPLKYDYVPITGYNTLTARLLLVPSFRHMYRKILDKVLTNYFNVSHLKEGIVQLHRKIRPYVLKDPFFNFIEIFDDEPEFILNFIKNRHNYLRNSFSALN